MTDSDGGSEIVTLTCEICDRQYTDTHDPKVVTETNEIATLFRCCSLECERVSWNRERAKRMWILMLGKMLANYREKYPRDRGSDAELLKSLMDYFHETGLIEKSSLGKYILPGIGEVEPGFPDNE